MIPKKIFFTKGLGTHKNKLTSFEMALRQAGIEKCNLVYVSSIFPPNCKIISRKEGLQLLKSGQITFCVLARNETNEPNRLISAAIGMAAPKDNNTYGYLSEHHTFGEKGEKSGEYAEDLATTMLATTLGIEAVFKTSHISQSAEGDKNGLWTTVISAAVFIID